MLYYFDSSKISHFTGFAAVSFADGEYHTEKDSNNFQPRIKFYYSETIKPE